MLNYFTGVGFGLMYLCTYVMIGHYFEKYRALATGIASCGSGVGTFIFAPLSVALINSYGWKGEHVKVPRPVIADYMNALTVRHVQLYSQRQTWQNIYA